MRLVTFPPGSGKSFTTGCHLQWLMLAIALFSLSGVANAARLFVDSSATGAETGLTWEDAFIDIQPALDTALDGDEVWVACATYTPTELADALEPRSARFVFRTGVSMFGGFSGGETNLDDRNEDPFTNGCVLGGVDDSTGYFTLMRLIDVPEPVIVDGFFLQGAAALEEFTNRGAGIGVVNSSLTGRNLRLEGLETRSGSVGLGGGIFADNSEVVLEDVSISNVFSGRGGGIALLSSSLTANRLIIADGLAGFGGGGAIFTNGSSEVEISEGVFERNAGANNGGGFLLDGGTIRFTRSQFYENRARAGGAILSRNGTRLLVDNSIFVGNRVTATQGGAIFHSSSNPMVVTNATIAENEASIGSGLYVAGNGGAVVQNTILFGNRRPITAKSVPQHQIEVDANATGEVVVSFSIVQDGFAGEGNLNVDPLFITSPNPGDGKWSTFEDNDLGDIRLQLTSPAIDSGNNSADLDGAGPETVTAADITVDVDGVTRVFDLVEIPDTGVGGPPVIDIGASEVFIEDLVFLDGFEA